MPTIIFYNKIYVKNRFIGESSRLIYDITEFSDWCNIEGFLVTMDIKKTFDSLEHDFLNSTLRKFGCGKNFMTCRKILLKDKLSCFMNSGTTTQYFNLEGGTSQGGPISV